LKRRVLRRLSISTLNTLAYSPLPLYIELFAKAGQEIFENLRCLGFRGSELIGGEIGDVLRPREVITDRRVVLMMVVLLRFILLHTVHIHAG
jgi:hypothetical protein